MSERYQAETKKFLAASAKFREAQTAYRARTIGDAEFLAARADFIAADKAHDLVEAEEFPE